MTGIDPISTIAALDNAAAAAAPVPAPFDAIDLKLVPVSSLMIDRTYQRKVSLKSQLVIKRIIQQFAWARFGAISVAKSADGFMVIDGQHRAIAAHQLKVLEVPCIVVTSSTEDQAADFVEINNNSTRIMAVDRFRARCAARDKSALELAQVLTNVGITTDVVPGTPLRPGQTRAISALEKLMRTPGPGLLFTTLEALTDAQPEQMNLLMAFNIKVATQLVAKVIDTGGDINEVVELFSITDFDSLHVDALSANRMFGGQIINHGTKLLSRSWNKGRRTARVSE